MKEHEIASEIKRFQELKKQDPNIDIASLALSTLQSHQQNILSDKEKRWGYLVSFLVPPFGLLFAVKFYASGRDDGKTAAYMCLALTAVSILFFVILIKLMLSGSGLSAGQVKQINTQDYLDLIQ